MATAEIRSSGSSTPNFSYDLVLAATTLTIPVNQQMIVSQNIQIDGTLVMNGKLVII